MKSPKEPCPNCHKSNRVIEYGPEWWQCYWCACLFPKRAALEARNLLKSKNPAKG